MKNTQSTDLAKALKGFFRTHLPQVKGMSPHTMSSYRDSLKLLLRFLVVDAGDSAKLSFDDISVDRVTGFLSHLEADRGNTVSTRNNRLAAIHSFFRYVAGSAPDHLELAQRILAIPFKRTGTRRVEYFEFDEFKAILDGIDLTMPGGHRDHALLVYMFNTGARVQEVCDLRASDLSLSPPFQVRILGKGRKERTCPLWRVTADLLRDFLEQQSIAPTAPVCVFTNRHGTPLTRFGIRYLLAKHIRQASASCPQLQDRRLHPHSVRHSTAVHLLKSGVDLASIASWLGHASVNTAGRYATIDLDMKRKAIEKAAPPAEAPEAARRWRDDPDILAWLESL